MIDTPGVYANMSFDDYLADPCPEPSLTRSTIKDLLFRSPLHAFYGHPRLNPNRKEKEKVKFDIGSAAHSIFLEGEDIAIFLDVEDWRTKAAQAAREEIYTKGKIPLLRKQHDEIMAMVEVAHDSLRRSELQTGITNGDSELTYIWKEGGIWCRTRPDWISKDRTLIIDYKTTSTNADPETYNRGLVVSMGLDIQSAFYPRGVKAIEKTEPDMIFMVQEIEEPYPCSFIRLDMMYADMGNQKVERGIKVWRECLKSGVWPGYPQTIYTVEPMPWNLASWEIVKNRG